VPNAYSQTFLQGGTATTQCPAWQAFTGALIGHYSSVTVSGSVDATGLTCAGEAANTICTSLAQGLTTTVACDGHTWYTGVCGGGTEVSVDANICTCASTNDVYTVRPCIGNDNWGGIGNLTCAAQTQTLNVVCR
jgi:hypothetical protein